LKTSARKARRADRTSRAIHHRSSSRGIGRSGATLRGRSRAAAARPDAVRGTLRLVRSAGEVRCRNARAGCAIAPAAVSAYLHECRAGRGLGRPQRASGGDDRV